MSGPRPSTEGARRFGVGLLLASLVVPALFVGLGEPPRAEGPERAVLVAPDATPEIPSDCDSESAPLLFLLPAGLVDSAVALPAPGWTPLAASEADRLSGDAAFALLPPPPRRA